GRHDEAAAVLAETWRHAPSRLLLAAAEPADGDAGSRLRHRESLVAGNPDHCESHLAVGEAAVAAEQWGLARRHLVAAAKAVSDRRVFGLMAEVEERETGDQTAAAMWHRREGTAPLPHWHCGACGAEVADWAPLCPSCDAVATIVWDRPPG
ncbi:MAG: hypothetical protein HQL38_16295, partial [Alphaproteobacteria bacterium]|nr:hypothetical protein [Alphaproteobacteria bacterium]